MTAEMKDPEIRLPFTYYEQALITRIHHFYISEDIGDPMFYTDMIHNIREGSVGDVIWLHLNTRGGNLTTGVQIINAMSSSAAKIVCSLEGEVHSLGTLIFLSADEFIVHDNCIMLFHNFSCATSGKGHEQRQQLNAIEDWFNQLSRAKYIPFMSEKEFKDMVDGKDIWLGSEEISERLKKMVELQEKEEPTEE